MNAAMVNKRKKIKKPIQQMKIPFNQSVTFGEMKISASNNIS